MSCFSIRKSPEKESNGGTQFTKKALQLQDF